MIYKRLIYISLLIFTTACSTGKYIREVPYHYSTDALYLFGWGRLEKMYSEYFTYNGNSKCLLNHTKHMKKEGEYEHYHHLHLTGFDHSLIKIIEK